MAESRKKLKTSNLFSSFTVSSNRNRSALVRGLLCNNSLFVGQLYKYKSLALRARDLIFFTTDLQTVNFFTQQFNARTDIFLNSNTPRLNSQCLKSCFIKQQFTVLKARAS